MIIAPIERQTIFDVALQHIGSIEGMFVLADRLNLNITDSIPENSKLDIIESDIINNIVVSSYKEKNIIPISL